MNIVDLKPSLHLAYHSELVKPLGTRREQIHFYFFDR